MTKYKININVFNGKDETTEFVGEFNEKEVNLFIARLIELGYSENEVETPCRNCEYGDCEGCKWETEDIVRKEYKIQLPEPRYDHHGSYYIKYTITEIEKNRVPIQEAINRIINPNEWDSYDYEEDDDTYAFWGVLE